MIEYQTLLGYVRACVCGGLSYAKPCNTNIKLSSIVPPMNTNYEEYRLPVTDFCDGR